MAFPRPLTHSQSRHKDVAKHMMSEVHEEGTNEVAEVANSGHWVVEEKPEDFVKAVLDFIQKTKTLIILGFLLDRTWL